jgi:dTDP-4-dehydrorhamnose 3,5-epimerase
MIFHETGLEGAYTIEIDRHADERGFFARAWCQREFANHGLDPQIVQCNISYHRSEGTMRGMHYQAAPYEEAKLVRCAFGALYDVIVDLRRHSPTYKRCFGVELTQQNRLMLYVPKGFAHGFLTLMDDTEVFYQMSAFYTPGAARGFRWDDPAFAIPWPRPVQVISERDAQYLDYLE